MLDDELRALVTVDAPDGFQSRVRARIAEEPARSQWWHLRRVWLVPVATLAAIMLAVWLNAPVEKPRDVEMLRSRATADISPSAVPVPTFVPPSLPAPSPGRVVSPSAGRTPSQAATLQAIQFDPAETRALHALFSSTPAIAIVTIVQPEDAPIVIPEILIAPLVAVDSKEGDRQ